MQTVAIICEYNPFHLGHKVQIDAVREMFPNESVCVLALMSGSFVQRGGISLLPSSDRAETALEMGADLVLELPFPWSMSGADYFAGGAVAILEALGGIDYLCFGSESGALENLRYEADRLNKPEFLTALDRAAREHPTLSWASVREQAYRTVYGEELSRRAPNDLLAIAYLSHLRSIKPLPITRKAGYSASAARNAHACGDHETLSTIVPPQTIDCLSARYGRAEARSAVDAALLSALRLMTTEELSSYAESSLEPAGLIARHLGRADTAEALVRACTNKKYTSARIRRVIWHAFLKTPAEMPKETPAYTRLLGCNETGREWLSAQRKKAEIPVITRLSNIHGHPEAERQFLFAQKRNELRAFLTDQAEKSLPIVK